MFVCRTCLTKGLGAALAEARLPMRQMRQMSETSRRHQSDRPIQTQSNDRGRARLNDRIRFQPNDRTPSRTWDRTRTRTPSNGRGRYQSDGPPRYQPGEPSLGQRSELKLQAPTVEARLAALSLKNKTACKAAESRLPPDLTPEEKEKQSLKYHKELAWNVAQHLKWLPKDPLKIAEHVAATLAKDKYDEAILLVREVSRDTRVTVSWNHLIDYNMKKQRLNAAIKVYNEMKKRVQNPDARTFTIIFRGCAASEHPKLAVHEALRIYNTMLNTGPVKPNTIHLNAVLDVCCRAGDLDSIFNILKTANEGIRKPDHLTFTTILTALRNSRATGADLTEEDANRHNELMLAKARKVWEDVLALHKKGRLLIDERLVCAFGRNLMLSDDTNEKKEVLELVHTHMKVPRFDLDKGAVPEPGSWPGEAPADSKPGNPTHHRPSSAEAPSTEEPPAPTGEEEAEPLSETDTQEPSHPVPAISEFQPKPPLAVSTSTPPTPSNNTLSLVLLCLENTKKSSVVAKYWDYFTGLHRVVPDRDNYIRYFKVLQRGRASAAAAAAIAAMPPALLNPTVFRMGLSTCIHDNLNRHAFANATLVFSRMVAASRYPDPLAMRLYLQVARASARHHHDAHPGDDAAAEAALGRQIYQALDRMWLPFRILMSSFSYPERGEAPTRSPREKWRLSEGEVQEALAVARRMMAAMDKLNSEKTVSAAELKTVMTRRTILVRLVERYADKTEERLAYDEKQKAAREKALAKKGRGPLGEEGRQDGFETTFRSAGGDASQGSKRDVFGDAFNPAEGNAGFEESLRSAAV